MNNNIKVENSVQRLEFIDLAKGFGMLMVVYLHVTINYPQSVNVYSTSHLNHFVHSMFMPIFFILSGIFFSIKQPFKYWVKKKIKRLIIPFFLFYILTYLINVIIVSFFDIKIKSGFSYWDIFVVFKKDIYPNSAIWFLLSLFWCSLILYCIIRLTSNLWKQLLIIILSFFIGYILEKRMINIPLYIDTSFSAMPFIYLGYLINRFNLINHLNIVNQLQRYSFILFISVICFVFDWFFGTSGSMVNNSGNSILFLISGITGSFSIIGIAYILNKLPLINYIGRYSMLILCTHMYLTNAFYRILILLNLPFELSSVIVTLLVLQCYYIIVPITQRIKILNNIL